VIVLELPDEEVQRRVLSRRICSQCGLDYNLIAHRPEVADVCDVCGGSLEQREDDTPDALARRLADYYAKTEPVIDVFGRKELVVRIDATPSRDEVFETIVDRLGLPRSTDPDPRSSS
jgi:adenylate kinase